MEHQNGVPSDWEVPRPPNIKFLYPRGPGERAEPVVWENLATENFGFTTAGSLFLIPSRPPPSSFQYSDRPLRASVGSSHPGESSTNRRSSETAVNRSRSAFKVRARDRPPRLRSGENQSSPSRTVGHPSSSGELIHAPPMTHGGREPGDTAWHP